MIGICEPVLNFKDGELSPCLGKNGSKEMVKVSQERSGL